MSALHTACETEVKIGGIDTALMQVLWNGFLAVRKMRVFARREVWKLRRTRLQSQLGLPPAPLRGCGR
jgi:hypothetical protein